MIKRKIILIILSLAIMFSLSTTLGFGINNASVVNAADAPSYVTVNAEKLYKGYYLESNDSVSSSTGATTEPVTYVAWYDGGILTLNGYNGSEITTGGDLTIKLNGENTITSSDKGIFASDCDNLIIDADSEATLNISVLSSTDEVYGISVGQGATAKTGSVTIKGKATVNINCESSVDHAYGIYTKSGFNIVDSANLNIKNISANPISDMSYSIVSFNNKPLFNTDGVVTLDNSKCAKRNYCISANNGIDMKKGTLICRYQPGEKTNDIYSYACSKKISAAPEGCVIREEPYYLGETVIKSGVGHTVTVENGLDYYGKDSNQYVAGETVYVKTNIEGLKFDKWEGAGIHFADATQKDTSFVMGDEDVTVKAVYNAFAKQPVFERINNDQGMISVQLNKPTSTIGEVVLLSLSGDVDVNVSLTLDPVLENYTYTCSRVWASYTPAGTYKIRVEYDGNYFYSDAFEIDYTDKSPFAKISDVIVNGKTGRSITPVSFEIILSNATFKSIAEGTDVSSWFNYLTNGLIAKIGEVSDGATRATITISGTPTATASSTIYLNIPKEVLATGSDNEIATQYNENAKFNIVKPANYGITVKDGKPIVGGAIQSFAEEGSTVTIKANDNSGYVFDKWVIISGDITLADENSVKTTFVMPESDVEIKATYKTKVYSIEAFVTAPVKDNTADTTITVNGTGYFATKVEWYKGEGIVSSMLMGATDKFNAGESYTVVVTVTLNSGYVFDSSTLYKSINGKAATINSGLGTDTISIKTTFTISVDPIPEHSVTVENGKLADGATTGSFTEGYSVEVTANAPATDMMFDKWIATGITLSSEQLSSTTITFTMGTNDITLTATYKAVPKYTVTNTDGTLIDGSTNGSFKAGESITIKADIKDGFTFDKWIATGITLSSEQLSSTTITFTMGTNDVTLTATYKAVPKYTVTITDGTLIDGSTNGSFKSGESITIKADIKEGFTFDKWIVTGITLSSEQLSSTTITFTMGTNDVTLTATYTESVVPAPKYNVKIENGTNSGGLEIEEGQIVTITAGVAPAGKVFDKWVVESGSVTLKNENSETTTFVMPNSEVKIKATYKDITSSGEDDTPLVPEEKGLPGGVIVGIVIGSILVASFGGLAIFWFAIKKKSFAELISRIKKSFKKK